MRPVPGLVVGLALLALAGTGLVLALTGRAGPDPAKWLLHESGSWALVLLVGGLGLSPLRRRAGVAAAVRWRRAVGLGAFALVLAHLLVYLGPYHALDAGAIADDLLRHPYILAGLVAALLLLPLAATSTRRAQRRLGRRWKRLHALVFLIAPLAVLHQGLAQKADLGETLLFCAFLGCFLFERAIFLRKTRKGVDRPRAMPRMRAPERRCRAGDAEKDDSPH